MVKLALVGCGGISGAHIKGYGDLFRRGCDAFVVTACCDPNLENAETRAREIAELQDSQPPVFASVGDLVKSGVAEAADVCVPHCFHHTVATELLEGGLHVMVEKPMGLTVKATKLIIETAEKQGRVLAYGENIRRYLTARSCEWAINTQGLIGEMQLVTLNSIRPQPFDYDNPALKWRGLKLLTGGGMIMDSGAHLADMVQVLFGDVYEVYCTMAARDNRMIVDAPVIGNAEADVEDTWHAVIRFKSGLHLTWTYSRSLHGDPQIFANYYGSRGMMKDLGFPFHPFQGGGVAHLEDGTVVSSEEIQLNYLMGLTDAQRARLFPYGSTDGFAIEAWDFVDAIANGRKPEMDGYDGLRAKTLSECCYESAVAGAPVKYDDVLEGRVDAYQRPIDEYWQI